MYKKYELIETNYEDRYRIEALKDFQLITGEVIKTGDLGGIVSGKHNLSQEGNCWISYHTAVSDNSRVEDNAVLKDFSCACGNSKVSGNAVMKDNSTILDFSTISGNAVMKDWSRICDSSTVSGNAVMKDYSCAQGDSIITGNAILQVFQRIQYGTVTTDLLGTKNLIGALYAELGVVPQNNKVILYKTVWSTDNPDVFKSNHRRNFLYKIGKISRVRNVDEDVFKSCTRGLHLTTLNIAKNYGGDTILECEVDLKDIITVQFSKVRTRKCKVIRVYKEE
ncbi:MAG: hypothetical protein BWY04_01107 [candidate division CPR1 bacterium ADurb.Bin160]|uniref:Uncharacterized protein n=1 Tax=candidate division CPR1 bacterium ADurb.Bin160 TaxID=1852826 RepID=A0A1V5ZLL1_9BACT|nr:MAG: hypothetical protein BWY04_01107 [candidate division CPR1 bacterium ADurb.Bin160]